jgi:F-type H+-transporting ATPase subunit a
MAAGASPTDHVMHEVQDHEGKWVVFERFLDGLEFHLPNITIGGYTFHFTKFMFLELLAAAILLAIFVPLAKRIQTGGLPRGRWWNLFETLLLFVRDEIARPNLDDPHPHHHAENDHLHRDLKPGNVTLGHADHGHGGHGEHAAAHAKEATHEREHEGDRFLPFLWTLFLFILVLNLLGMIPFLGSATASIWVTGALALVSFVMMHGVAIAAKHGNVFAYLKSLWPPIDVPYVGWLFSGAIFLIELMGTGIKAFVLAVRLFANMFAGHMVLGMILFFIYVVGTKEPESYALWAGVSIASVLGVVALSLLELFVAFLQAYVFTFLTALFMGMNLYPEH